MDLTQLEELFKLDYEANYTSIEEYKEALNYYHAYQLPKEVESITRQRGQIPIQENSFKAIVNSFLGYKTQAMQEIKVSGRQEEDKALANILNDLLKVFSGQSNYNKEIVKRDLNLILGEGVIELWVLEDEEGNVEIDLKSIPPQSFVIDKYSTDKNALDSKRFHKMLDMDLSEAKRLFRNKEILSYEDGTYQKRCKIIESWIKEEGSWNRYIWCYGYALYAAEKSPFKNNCHPFVIAKYCIDPKGKWYGIFRDIKPLQDYINFAEIRMGNMLGTFKAFYEEDAILDKEEFIQSASLDNSFTEVRSGGLEKIKFVENRADIAVLSQKVNEKRALMKSISGINDEILGLGGSRQSGVAIAQRRDAGLMSLQDYIKTSDDMDRLIFQKVLDFIQHYFTKKQVFRIVDKKVGERYFGINENAENQIRIGKFDLEFKSTLKMLGREERFAHWSEMLKTIASVNPALVSGLLPLMLKDTDSPIVADVEEILQSQQAQAQEAGAMQQQAANSEMQLIAKEREAKIAETLAKAKKYDAQGELARRTEKNTIDLR